MAECDWGDQPGSRMGLDIGGTLTKFVFFESNTRPTWCNGRFAQIVKSFGKDESERPTWGERDHEMSFTDDELAGTFHFVTFRSDHMEKFVGLLEEHALHDGLEAIFACGGGAHKYARLFKERLGVTLRPVDELGVVIQGITWLVDRPMRERVATFLDHPSRSPSSVPSDSEADPGPRGSASSSTSPVTDSTTASTPSFASTPPRNCLEHGARALFPFLLVNIGSGVSVVRVDGLDRFERVSGSAVGGGTFWGLCQLLCPDCSGFEEAGQLAEQGDASSVNLLVEDIYGGDYTLPNGIKLPGSITASFFAKAANAGRNGTCSDADKLHALTKMVSSNICQIAYLNARLHNTQRIVFTGNFLRQNPVARQAISENMQRVSQSHMTRGEEPFRALFLQHEGYFGALGTFLHNVQEHTGPWNATPSPSSTGLRLPTFRRSARELANAIGITSAKSEASGPVRRRGGAANGEPSARRSLLGLGCGAGGLRPWRRRTAEEKAAALTGAESPKKRHMAAKGLDVGAAGEPARSLPLLLSGGPRPPAAGAVKADSGRGGGAVNRAIEEAGSPETVISL